MDFNIAERIVNLSDPLITKEYEDISLIITNIKELPSATKFEQRLTLCVMSLFVERADTDIFNENVFTWMRVVMQIMTTAPVDQVQKICHQILTVLLKRSILNEKTSREISLKAIDPLLALLTGPSNNPLASTFKLIVTTIKCYPSPCWKYHKEIEKFLNKSMKSLDVSIQQSASLCLPFTSFVGAGGEKRVKHSDAWLLLLNRVIKTTSYFTDAFQKCLQNKEMTVVDDDESDVKLLFADELLNTVDKYSHQNLLQLSQYIKNLLLSIQGFVSESTPFHVEVPLSHLVNLFHRISLLASENIRNYHINKADINVLVSGILDALLQTITLCVRQFTTLLLPYYNSFTDILASTFQLDAVTNQRNNYKCIKLLLTTWRVMPKNGEFVEKIVDKISDDIHNVVERIADSSMLNLESTACEVKNKSKKNKRKNNTVVLLQNEIIASNSDKKNSYNFIDNSDTNESLDLLKVIIQVCGSTLKPFLLKKIVSIIVSAFTTIFGKDNNISKISRHVNFFYLIFQVSNELLNLYHYESQIPFSILLNFMDMGSRHADERIGNFCKTSLMNTDRMIHPSNPVLREECNVNATASAVVNGYMTDKELMNQNRLEPEESQSPVQIIEQPVAESATTNKLHVATTETYVNGANSTSNPSPSKSMRKRSAGIQEIYGEKQPLLKRACRSADDINVSSVAYNIPSRPHSEPARSQVEGPVSNLESNVSTELRGKALSIMDKVAIRNDVVVVDSSGEDDDDGEEEKDDSRRQDDEKSTDASKHSSDVIENNNLGIKNSKSNSLNDSINVDEDDDIDSMLETFSETPADC